MFAHKNTKEDMTNEVVVEGVCPEAVKSMLDFAYDNVLENIPDDLEIDVLKLADRYLFETLKLACEEKRKRKLG